MVLAAISHEPNRTLTKLVHELAQRKRESHAKASLENVGVGNTASTPTGSPEWWCITPPFNLCIAATYALI